MSELEGDALARRAHAPARSDNHACITDAVRWAAQQAARTHGEPNPAAMLTEERYQELRAELSAAQRHVQSKGERYASLAQALGDCLYHLARAKEVTLWIRVNGGWDV